jgi:hypothetical protein
MRHSLLQRLVTPFTALALAGCFWHPYNKTYYTAETRPRYLAAGFRSPIVEFDDDGYMRAPWQLDSALFAMDTAASTTLHRSHPVVVLVFIHGWHNNASLDNDNLQKFNQFADALQARLQSDTATARTTVLPIYFAWRGQNTLNPHWYNSYIIPFIAQYLTFFSRKSTAERIGRGELEVALARISQKWHEWRLSPSSVQRENFLVIAGHSFGGAALLTATLPQLAAEQEAIREKARVMLSGGETSPSIVAPPPPDSSTRAQAAKNVSRLAPANLLIAVNPAIEASMMDRTVLSHGAPFAADGQEPQLLVLDADNDRPRSVFFKIGQSLGNLTHVRTPHSQAERLAVAKLPGQVQFSLSREDGVPKDGHACPPDATPTYKLHLVALDNRPCLNTIMVVQTHQKIVNGHSGIWGDDNREFLIRFVGQQQSGFVKSVR